VHRARPAARELGKRVNIIRWENWNKGNGSMSRINRTPLHIGV
jgi:hypothetical protein